MTNLLRQGLSRAKSAITHPVVKAAAKNAILAVLQTVLDSAANQPQKGKAKGKGK